MPRMRIKDKNPQFLKMQIVESAANTWTSYSVATPVVQDLMDGKALVMEILKVAWDLTMPEITNVQSNSVQSLLTDRAFTDWNTIGSAGVIDKCKRENVCFDTGATDATLVEFAAEGIFYHDLTDGAGNGILYGASSIFLGVRGINCAAVKTASINIIYRLKEVSAAELLGIIRN